MLNFADPALLALAVAARRGGIPQNGLEGASLARMMMVDGEDDDAKEVKCDHWSMQTRSDHANVRSSVTDRN